MPGEALERSAENAIERAREYSWSTRVPLFLDAYGAAGARGAADASRHEGASVVRAER